MPLAIEIDLMKISIEVHLENFVLMKLQFKRIGHCRGYGYALSLCINWLIIGECHLCMFRPVNM